VTSAVSDWEIERRQGALPEGWAEATLEEIVVHKLGGLWGAEPSRAAVDPALARVRVIRGTDFRDWERDKGTRAAERAIPRSKLAARQLAAGDLVVEISGGGAGQPVGRTLLIDEEAVRRADAPLICSNFCRQVRIHPEIDPAFIHLVLQLRYLCGSLDEHQTQTTNLRNLSFSRFLAGVVLPIPPRAEQRRIVTRVAELMAPVQRAQGSLARARETVRRFRQSVLADAVSGRLSESWRAGRRPAPDCSTGRLERVFAARLTAYEQAGQQAEACGRRAPRRPRNLSPLGWESPAPLESPEVPAGWALVALQDVAHRVQYGLSIKTEGDAKTGVAILRMTNIQDGELDASALKYADRQGLDLPELLVRRGDVLFNRTNCAEQVGKAAAFELDLEAVFASYLVRIECDERLLCGRYLCAWINSPWGRRWARTVRTDCSNQSNINVARLRRLPVPLPPLAEQREIVRLIAACFAFAGAAEARVAAAAERVERVRRAVLARALRGELVPTAAELAAAGGGPSRGTERPSLRPHPLAPSPKERRNQAL
jgi:type I restriction enzyme, S subunit